MNPSLERESVQKERPEVKEALPEGRVFIVQQRGDEKIKFPHEEFILAMKINLESL